MKRNVKGFIEVLVWIMPPIVMAFIKSIYLLIRKPFTWKRTFHNFSRMHSTLLILGNGPSLQTSLTKLDKDKNDYDCVAVNSFATTSSYEVIKPNMYILADTAYFLRKEDLLERVQNVVDSLADCLVKKTTWELSLFVPNYGEKSEFIRKVKTNPFIKVYYFNMHDHFIPIGKGMKYYLWDKNWNAFAGQTVLNTCVNLGIVLKYKEIYLVGADTSWHENLRIEQDNNKLYTIDKHFYGDRKVYVYADPYGKIPERLDRELISVSKALSLYWELKEYADTRNVRIYNASEYSDIDAFPRMSLDNSVIKEE